MSQPTFCICENKGTDWLESFLIIYSPAFSDIECAQNAIRYILFFIESFTCFYRISVFVSIIKFERRFLIFPKQYELVSEMSFSEKKIY